ncbi:MAG: hypothetical protein ACRD3J_29815 [Thermoanaerobaculia bacterium]
MFVLTAIEPNGSQVKTCVTIRKNGKPGGYRAMYLMTGRYLALLKKYSEALLAYQAAMKMDPSSSAIEQEMQLVESRTSGK